MERMFMIAYRYREDLDEDDLRDLTKKFTEVGTSAGVVAHYERLDGKGGFMLQRDPDDHAKEYELTLQYGRWMNFEAIPVTTIEEAFPVIQKLYG